MGGGGKGKGKGKGGKKMEVKDLIPFLKLGEDPTSAFEEIEKKEVFFFFFLVLFYFYFIFLSFLY